MAVQGNWLLPASPHLPAVRAEVFPIKNTGKAASVQLDIEVVPDHTHRIVESFAGLGTSLEAAVQDAVDAFRGGVLDVLLNVFWDAREPNRVEMETWSLGGQSYSVTIGPWLLRNLGADVALPDELLDVLANLLGTAPTEDELYWIRIFYCNAGDGSTITEVRLNNSRWVAAESRIAQLGWIRTGSYYSARLFVVLRRTRSPATAPPP